MVDSRDKVAVITGGSSGLGLAMAREFKSNGFKVVVIARSCPANFIPDEFIGIDLISHDGVANVIRTLNSKYSEVDVLINNAGIGSYATSEELPENELRRIFELDYFALVGMSRGLLGALEKAQGTVVNISSVAGLMPVACMGAYSAAKAAVWMFSESLRMETQGRIHVMTVAPGRINTGFSARAVRIRPVPETPGQGSATAERLAKLVVSGVKSHRQRLIYPGFYRIVIWFANNFPGLYAKCSRKVWGLR